MRGSGAAAAAAAWGVAGLGPASEWGEGDWGAAAGFVGAWGGAEREGRGSGAAAAAAAWVVAGWDAAADWVVADWVAAAGFVAGRGVSARRRAALAKRPAARVSR